MPGHAAPPMHQAAIDDDPSPNAGADGHIDKMPQALPGTELPLPVCRGNAVVLHDDRQAVFGCQDVS
jgi:hypothetical protein